MTGKSSVLTIADGHGHEGGAVHAFEVSFVYLAICVDLKCQLALQYWFDVDRAKVSDGGSADARSLGAARSSFADDDPYYVEMLKKFKPGESQFIERNVQQSP